jgi:hypothetical protein
MRPRLALALASLSLTALLGGCVHAHESFYREAERAPQPRPVPLDQVGVFRSAHDLRTPWIELGRYVGHAPTVTEAIVAAQRTCGRDGADAFILDAKPLEARGLWKVSGACASRSPTPSE